MTSLLLLGAAHVHLSDHVRMAREHGVEIRYVFDRDESRRAAWCDELDAEPLDSLDEIGQTGCTGALCCSETLHHEADVSAALSAGLPTFCEKPLAASGEAARRLAGLAQRTGVRLDTGLFLRSQEPLQTLRGQIRDGALGPVHEARARFAHDGGFADWLDLSGWMTDPQRAVYGGFGDEAIHAIDQVIWMLGPVVGARCQLGRALELGLDDHGIARLQFESGAQAIVAGGWVDPVLRFELEVVGANGWAQVRDGDARLYKRGQADPVWQADLAALDAGEGSRPFFEALTGADNAPVLCPPDEAADLNHVLDWCYTTSG